jgi:hypothetical protein
MFAAHVPIEGLTLIVCKNDPKPPILERTTALKHCNGPK